MVNMVRFEAGKLAEMWFGMDPLVELQQMGIAPASPPRPYRPTEQANLTAFLGATEMGPADCDNVTAFGDTVVALSPPQASPSSVSRLVEVHRFTGDDHALVYRHEITTKPPYGGDPSVDTEMSRAVVDRWFDEVLGDHDLAALAEVASPNILVHPTAMPCEAGYCAKGGVEQWLAEQWSAFPDLRVVDDFTVASRRHRGRPLACPGNIAGRISGPRPDWPKPRLHGPFHVPHRGRQDRRDLGDAEHPGHPPPAGPADRGRTPPLNSPAVRLATFEDAGPVADLLADAFLDYEWSRWAVPADNHRERLRGLHLLYAGLLGAEVGGTWVTDDISSVVNWVKPGRTPISDELSARLNEESTALFGDRLEAVDALEAKTAPLRPAGPHWYLATVGTRPDRRREGLASLVIRAGLAACDEAGLPAAVETSNEANCRLYERLGFQAAGDRTAPDGGLRVWVLVRPAQR